METQSGVVRHEDLSSGEDMAEVEKWRQQSV